MNSGRKNSSRFDLNGDRACRNGELLREKFPTANTCAGSGLDNGPGLQCVSLMNPENGPPGNQVPFSQPQDTLTLHGYKQELKREIGWFSSFSMSFSIIAVTTGLFATYGAGLQTAGPAFIWTWPIVGAGQLVLAVVFAKLARRIPLSGRAHPGHT